MVAVTTGVEVVAQRVVEVVAQMVVVVVVQVVVIQFVQINAKMDVEQVVHLLQE